IKSGVTRRFVPPVAVCLNQPTTGAPHMKNKIGLEEHFSVEDTLMDSHGFVGDEILQELRAKLLDIDELRLGQLHEQGSEQLNVPFYLHPREPAQKKPYEGHPWLIGPAYGFAAETALHTLRLLGCGLFDKYPKLTLILGHLGENLPFTLHRTDRRIDWAPMG